MKQRPFRQVVSNSIIAAERRDAVAKTALRLDRRIDDLHNSVKPDIAALETRLQSLESFREMIFTFLTSLTIHKDVVLQVKLERERNERLKEEYPDA